MTKIQDWDIPTEEFYGLDPKEENIEIYFHQSNKFDKAILFYDIGEAPNMCISGRFRLYSNKKKPKLIFAPEIMIRCFLTKNPVFWFNLQSIVCVFPIIYDPKRKISELPFLLLDVDKQTFSFIKIENACLYKIIELGDKKIKLSEQKKIEGIKSRDGEIIDLDSLSWYPLKEFKNIKQIYMEQLGR